MKLQSNWGTYSIVMPRKHRINSESESQFTFRFSRYSYINSSNIRSLTQTSTSVQVIRFDLHCRATQTASKCVILIALIQNISFVYMKYK
jgi:hypothetical protein